MHFCYTVPYHPNPFNPTTEITYSLPEAGHVSIEIFDASGRRITHLVDKQKSAGIHKATWNGLDQGGTAVSSGIYFYRIKTGKWSQSRKMVLMR
ncbi:MAG: T9SS type A sorting domain-containing protein [Candidatus Krumholzibacteria bacterium]|nr:T9SS type A sorting domain-containing protein [Candidatus Krumholzibacteria bacterium]